MAWVLGAVAVVGPLAAPNDYWIGEMARICLYATLALGLNIVVGFAGLLDLGYVAFFGIGSYLYTFLASAHFGLHLPFLVTLPIVILLTAGSGILIGATSANASLLLTGSYTYDAIAAALVAGALFFTTSLESYATLPSPAPARGSDQTAGS